MRDFHDLTLETLLLLPKFGWSHFTELRHFITANFLGELPSLALKTFVRFRKQILFRPINLQPPQGPPKSGRSEKSQTTVRTEQPEFFNSRDLLKATTNSATPYPSSSYPAIHSLCLLIKDFATCPIIHRSAQTLWLGIHLRAPLHLSRLLEKDRREKEVFNRILIECYARLRAKHSKVVQICKNERVSSPRLLTWLSELLLIRDSVARLRRSNLRSFLIRLEHLQDLSLRNTAEANVHEIVEILSIFSNDLLEKFVQHARESKELPSIKKAASWFKTCGNCTYESVENRTHLVRNILVTGHLRVVLSRARSYVDHGLSYDDLVQEGFLGLMKAAERFDYRKTMKFSPYGALWVHQNIARAIADRGRTIRLPAHLYAKIKEVEGDYRKKRKENPAVPPSKLYEDMLESKKVSSVLRKAVLTVPIDLSLPQEASEHPRPSKRTDGVFSTNLACIMRVSPAPITESILNQQYRASIRQSILALTHRQASVLTLRFGLEDDIERTLEEVGQKLNLTRERIRQIQNDALVDLRAFLPQINQDELRDLNDTQTTINEPLVPGKALEFVQREVNFASIWEACDEPDKRIYLDRIINEQSLPRGGSKMDVWPTKIRLNSDVSTDSLAILQQASISSIALLLSKTMRNDVLRLRRSYKVSHLRNFLLHRSRWAEFSAIFNRLDKIVIAVDSINRFIELIDTWNAGHRSERIRWVVRSGLTEREIRKCILTLPLFKKTLGSVDNKWPAWLPFLSIRLANEIRGLRRPQLNLLAQLLQIMSRDFTGSIMRGPWEDTFPNLLKALPTATLFQYKPDVSTERLLQKLLRAGCQNIGHLVVFEPSFVRVVRSLETDAWIRVSRVFDGYSGRDQDIQ